MTIPKEKRIARYVKEGFWKSIEEPDLPLPIKNQISIEESIRLSTLLAQIEKRRETEFKKYKGKSYCRFTNKTLNSGEYSLNGFIWPQDFRTHYIRKYRIKPSEEFLSMIKQYIE